jgi:uncharacterized protein
MKCKMKAKAPVNPTEDLEKVIKAMETLFNYDELVIEDNYVSVSGERESLLRFKDSLEKRKIRSTARRILSAGVNDNTISFKLNKQAAFAGLVNFTDEELPSLGEIEVKIETDNVETFLDWIAPQV